MESLLSHCYGIDIGGSKIELVACEASTLDVTHRRRIDTPGQDFDAFVTAIAALVDEADAVLGMAGDPRRCAPVGLGMPGVVDRATGRQLSSNVPALNGRRVGDVLRRRLARSVYFGNDCQCFALSEAQGGAAHGLPSMFGAILGTGAGGGFCVEGKLVAGHNGFAGEWGHCGVPAALLTQYGLPIFDCPCGLRGCLERYVAGPALTTLYRLRGGLDEASPATIVARADSGETAARVALDLHLDLLGHGLAALVLTLDPHAIVLGGGLSKLDHLYARLPEAIGRHLFEGAEVPPILRPAFGDAGGARGAALLARQRHDRSSDVASRDACTPETRPAHVISDSSPDRRAPARPCRRSP
ncbi:ROK family protein [Tahibacter amnicola]|uniref:ROK family protein n=1 Tax=Tahibacter amnicola TaxID=2976241 RepID=A0ABY6BM88_9GAMM|nr:ROK family protein [Tahibacter amnicola]UXI70573.1 ROK family protein [Tahibacter amnicola]